MPREPNWTSATVKLTCNCNFSIPPVKYDTYAANGMEEWTCSTHGKQFVLRVSRLGKS